MKHSIYIAFIFCLILGISCTVDEECRKDRYVEMKVNFYKKTLNTTTQTFTTSTLSIDSLTVQGLDTLGVLVDSILYNKSKKVSSIYLPLNKFVEVSKFVVTFNQTIDTITISHINSNDYLSLECGCLKVHTIDTVLTTNHFVDSVKITNHKVNTINAEHLQIYN